MKDKWVYIIEHTAHGKNVISEFKVISIKKAGYRCNVCYKLFNEMQDHKCKPSGGGISEHL